MKRMLEKNPQNRISAKEALNHPYFSAPSDSMECIDEVKDNIKIYNSVYKKSFDSIENNWLINPGQESTGYEDSILFYNKIAINGKLKTVEKMSRESNLSIKFDIASKFTRSQSVTKACRISSDSGKVLMNSCRSAHKVKGQPNIYEAFNYINLMGEVKKTSMEKILKADANIIEKEEVEVSGKSLEEKKTRGKLEDIGFNHDFAELIKRK